MLVFESFCLTAALSIGFSPLDSRSSDGGSLYSSKDFRLRISLLDIFCLFFVVNLEFCFKAF